MDFSLQQALVLPTTGHWDTCPLDFQRFNFFQLTLELHEVWHGLCAHFLRLPLQTCLYSAIAAAVVQSRLHEPCSVYYFTSFYVRQTVSCSFVPLLVPDPGMPVTTRSTDRLIDWLQIIIVDQNWKCCGPTTPLSLRRRDDPSCHFFLLWIGLLNKYRLFERRF